MKLMKKLIKFLQLLYMLMEKKTYHNFKSLKNETDEIEKWFSNLLGWKEIPQYEDNENDDDYNNYNDDNSNQNDADIGDL